NTNANGTNNNLSFSGTTLTLASNLNQNLDTNGSPSFSGLTVDSGTTMTSIHVKTTGGGSSWTHQDGVGCTIQDDIGFGFIQISSDVTTKWNTLDDGSGNLTAVTITDTSLTGSALVATDGDSELQSVTISNSNGSNGSFSGSTLTLSNTQDLSTSGTPSFSSLTLTDNSNQLSLGGVSNGIINLVSPDVSGTVYTIPDVGDSNFIMSESAQTINGVITFNDKPIVTPIKSNLNVVCDNSGSIDQSYPSVWNLPYASTTQWYYSNSSASSGLTTIYTVPSSNCVILTGITVVNNSVAATTIKLYASDDAGTTLYPITISGAIAANASAGISTNSYIFQPGDTILLNSSQSTQQYTVGGYQFSTTGHNLKSIIYRNLPTGTTTVYTCPSSTKAITVNAAVPFNVNAGAPRVGNRTGATIVYKPQITSGGVTATTAILTVTNDQMAAGTTVAPYLVAGDTIAVNTNGTGTTSHFWMAVLEYPSSVI
ncbi:MAG TPA: hypothetical protein VHD33_01195, partial [Legionellaceae bacterium]|nr:hypothetical protein [Legionellaceae bacterium]